MEIRRDHLEPEFFYHIYNRGINSEDVYKNKDNYLPVVHLGIKKKKIVHLIKKSYI